jgi:paraquat-inducible protein A
MTALKIANLALLILFPISWFAPLLRAGIDLPLFSTRDISVVSGLQQLWETDVFLALAVTLLAVFFPLLKTIGLALIHFGVMRRRALPALEILGKLAMADVFLIALYIVVAKGVALTRIEVGWGLYLFTGCVMTSIIAGFLTGKRRNPHAFVPATEKNS